MGSPAIFSGNFMKSLKSQFNLGDATYFLTGTADPTSSAQNAPAGSIYQNTSTGNVYKKNDNGNTTNWSILVVGSQPALNVVTKTAAYTVTTANDVILGDVSAGTFAITLLTAAGNTGKVFTIKKSDSSSNVLTLNTTSSQTIDGQTSVSLCTLNDEIVVISDGANWKVQSRNAPIFALYITNGGQSITANTTDITFSTKTYDSNSAWNGTQFTAPRAGFYLFKGRMQTTTSTGAQIRLYVNSSFVLLDGQDSSSDRKPFAFAYYLNAGDTASFRSDTSVTLQASTTAHWIAISSQSG